VYTLLKLFDKNSDGRRFGQATAIMLMPSTFKETTVVRVPFTGDFRRRAFWAGGDGWRYR
jgi:hypothetical protein